MPFDPDLAFPSDDEGHRGMEENNYREEDTCFGEDYDEEMDGADNPNGETKGQDDDFDDLAKVTSDVLWETSKTQQHGLSPAKALAHTPASSSTLSSARVAVFIPSSVKKTAFAYVPDDDERASTPVMFNFAKQKKLASASATPQTFYEAAVNGSFSSTPAAASTEPSSALLSSGRKRGRPKGWRKGMGNYANATPTTASTAPYQKKDTSEYKRRGRSARTPGPGPRDIFKSLTPKYIPFICEWEKCPAELHNSETLRKHVHIVHGGMRTCRWGQCADPTSPHLSFPDLEAFKAHFEQKHMIPFLWHCGDGPRCSATGLSKTTAMAGNADPLPSYLFDDDGNQVTPSVREQRFENEEEKKQRRKALRRILKQRDAEAPYEEYMAEELAAMVGAKS